MERWEQLEQLFLGRWSPASNRADMALRDACKRISESEAERDRLKAEVERLRVEMDCALGINGDEA